MIKIGEFLRKLWSLRSCFNILPPGALTPQGIEGAMERDVSKQWCTLQWCASRGWFIAHENWTSCLTASWFNDINIGYRFHISTVCHSCCNNVMYFSKENLDISGSTWKKYHAGMAFLLARIVLVLKLYIQGESCVRPMQASAARLRPGSGILFYDIYWYLHYISMIVINVYNNYVFHVKLDMISWCSVPSPAYTSCHVTITPPLRQNNIAMTFGVVMTLLLRHLYVVIYIQRFACRAVYT